MSETPPQLSLVDGPAPAPLTRRETRRRQRELEYATAPDPLPAPAAFPAQAPVAARAAAPVPGPPSVAAPAVPAPVPVRAPAPARPPAPVPARAAAPAPPPAPGVVRVGRRRPVRERARSGALPPGAAELLAVLDARPWLALDVADLVAVTGVSRREALGCLEALIAQRRVTARTRDGRVCYTAAQ